LLTVAAAILSWLWAAADDSVPADLVRAKDAHAKELARLRDRLLGDIDGIIKAEKDRGAGIDFLLKERKGFADEGVVPLLPKLLPASQRYQDDKRKADAALEAAYAAAIDESIKARHVDQAVALRADLKKFRSQSGPPAGAKDPKTEAEVERAKSDYAAAMKAAAADLIDAFESARTRIATSAKLSNDEKLKSLNLLKKEMKGFEANATLPTSSALRAGRKHFDEAAHAAQQVFSKSMDAAAEAYMERKDLANAQVVTDEKKRLMIHPNSIDLLALVEVSKDAIAGEWEYRKKVLTLVKPVEISIIQIPYEPGPEYNLHLTVERLEGNGYLAIGVVASGRQCTVMFDGHAGPQTGIQLIDGKYLNENGTGLTGQQLLPRKVTHLDLSIRKDSINAWVKGPEDAAKGQVIEYEGPQDRLSVETDWVKGLKNANALFLHQHTSKFAISSLELDPVGRDAGKAAR
jgi:hypothetical protein